MEIKSDTVYVTHGGWLAFVGGRRRSVVVPRDVWYGMISALDEAVEWDDSGRNEHGESGFSLLSEYKKERGQ